MCVTPKLVFLTMSSVANRPKPSVLDGFIVNDFGNG